MSTKAGELQKAHANELDAWRDPISRLVDLFARLRRTRDTEIAATVHFAASELARANSEIPVESDVLNAVMEWKQRKTPPLTTDEVVTAMRSLAMRGWLELKPVPGLHANEAALVGLDEPALV